MEERSASPGDSSRKDSVCLRKSRRYFTVYDAVSGRVVRKYKHNRGQKIYQQTAVHGRLSAGEVLFYSKNAPPRCEEKDIYSANEDLPGAGRNVLPESEMVKAIHSYSSRFYEALAQRQGPSCMIGTRLVDEQSMDETGLLAFGILMEEACREMLTQDGERVLAEVDETEGNMNAPGAGRESPKRQDGASHDAFGAADTPRDRANERKRRLGSRTLSAHSDYQASKDT